MRNSAGPDDAPDTAPDNHVRPRHVAPLRTANDRTARLGLEPPPATTEFHTRPLPANAAPGLDAHGDDRRDPEGEEQRVDRLVLEQAPAEIAEQRAVHRPQDRRDEDVRREPRRPAKVR